MAFAADAALRRPMRGRAAEHDDVEQRVGTKPVGAVNRNAGRLADRHQSGHDCFRIAVALGDDLAMQIGRYAAHVVVHGRQHRDRLARHVDAGEDPRGLADARQPLVQDVGAEMLQVQLDVVLVRPAAAALVDLDGHGAADDVTSGEILRGRRIALHEALAFRIGEIATLPARAFRDQAA